jgi:hypothetical protein
MSQPCSGWICAISAVYSNDVEPQLPGMLGRGRQYTVLCIIGSGCVHMLHQLPLQWLCRAAG